MRVSTNYIFSQNLTAMLNQQSDLGKTQLQISTGKKILNPSDDPAASVEILNLQREFSLSEQYKANATKAKNKQVTEEGTLQSAGNMLQRIRELAVQGLNATNTQNDKQAIAAEINQLNQQLLALANTRDANGDYLFSGFESNVQPYETIQGDYQGDEGQRNIKIGSDVFIESNDPGNHVFEAPLISTTITSPANAKLSITDTSGVADTFPTINFTFNQSPPATTANYSIQDADGNTASVNYVAGEVVDLSKLNPKFPSLQITLSGTPINGDVLTIEKNVTVQSQSLFKTIDNFTNALINDDVGANASPNNGDFLTNLSTGLARIIDKRADVGARLNAIEQQNNINDGLSYNMKKTLSELEDLDYAEAVSRLALQTTGLQAAQQSFVKVQGLSLFNYL